MQSHPIANHRRSLPRSFFSILALALAIVLLAHANAAIATIPAPTPLWEMDLSKFGYEPRPPESREADGTHYFHWPTRQTMGFTQEDLLAVSFETHPESDELSSRTRTLPPIRIIS
jgi:hypothetical protein